MAATRKFTLAFHSSTVKVESVKGLIAGSQGILIPGAPMYLSQSGTWKVADTSDGTGDVIHGFLMGRVASPTTWPLEAELTANDGIYVALADTRHIYAVYVENAGTDSAVAQAQVGNEYGLTVSTTSGEVGLTTLDINNSNDTVVVVDIASNKDTTGRKYTTSDAPGVAYVRILRAAIEAEKA